MDNPAPRSKSATSANSADVIRFSVTNNLQQFFTSTLNQEPDIINIFMALIFKESSNNVSALGPVTSVNGRSTGGAYISSSAVKAVLNLADPVKDANITRGLQGLGLTQSMGYNHVKGGSPSGICEIQRLRPEFASTLCVNPGDSLDAILVGPNNISNNVLAGLIILEGKYKAAKQSQGGWTVNGISIFPSRISAAVGAYLGTGAGDILGTSPANYAAAIIGGDAYAKANSNSAVIRNWQAQTIAQGPSTNGSGMPQISPPGC